MTSCLQVDGHLRDCIVGFEKTGIECEFAICAEHIHAFPLPAGQCISDPEGNISLRRRIGCSKTRQEMEATTRTKRSRLTNENKFRATGYDRRKRRDPRKRTHRMKSGKCHR